MPSIYQLKPAFQNILRPMVNSLFKLGITANMVTLFAMFISLFVSYFLYNHYSNHPPSIYLLVFPLWMLLRMAFNAIDGMLAREFDQKSDLGAYFNELCDVISDTVLYLSLISLSVIQPALLLLVVFLAILSEYAGVMAPLIGKERRYDGPMGKSDRAFWFSLITIIIYFFSCVSIHQQLLNRTIQILLILITLLLCYTIYNRIKNSLRS